MNPLPKPPSPRALRARVKSKFGPEQEVFLMLFLVVCIIAWTMGDQPSIPRAILVDGEEARPALPVEEPALPESQDPAKNKALLPTQLTLWDTGEGAFFPALSVEISDDFAKQLRETAFKLDHMARQHQLDAVEVVGFADGTVMHTGVIRSSGVDACPVKLEHSLGDLDCLAGAWLDQLPFCRVPTKSQAASSPSVMDFATLQTRDLSNKSTLQRVVNSNIELGMLRALAIIRHLRILREQDRYTAEAEGRPPVLSTVRQFLPLSAGSFTSPSYTLIAEMDGQDIPERRRIDLRLFSRRERLSAATAR